MKKTGEILRQAREEKNLSINEVGISLKISNKVISAIEAGDVSHLPAKTFLRGFVQSYAQFLKLNVNEVMELFRQEMGTTQPQPTILDSSQEGDPEKANVASHSGPKISPVSQSGVEKKNQIPYQRLIISAVSVFLVLCIYFVKRTIDRYQRESIKESVDVGTPIDANDPQIPVLAPTEGDSEKPDLIPEAATAVDGKVPTMPSSNMSVKPSQSTPAPATTPTITIKPSDTKPPEVKTAEKVSEKVVEKPIEKIAENKPIEKKIEAVVEKPVEKPAEKPQPRPLEVVIEALDSVEVTYTDASGKIVEKIKLNAEQVHTIRGKQGLKIGLSNGGAANIILNGKDKGVAGDLGKPATLVY